MTVSNNKGVALIQVLIMTAIMSLIAIQFTQTAREQVSTAQSFKQRIKAELLLKTTKSQLLFEFFKNDSSQLSDKIVNGIKWNLRGKPFVFSANVKVKIQSASGLLSVLTTSDEYWHKVLTYLGEDETSITQIINSLRDWVDIDDNLRLDGAELNQYLANDKVGPRNGPLQHISELSYINGISPQLYQQLKPLVTIYTTGSFNPSLAPKQLINALFSSDVAEQIIVAQNQANFTEETWRNIVGSREYEFVDIHPRSTFMINITVEVGDVILTEGFALKVQSQKARNPLTILANY